MLERNFSVHLRWRSTIRNENQFHEWIRILEILAEPCVGTNSAGTNKQTSNKNCDSFPFISERRWFWSVIWFEFWWAFEVDHLDVEKNNSEDYILKDSFITHTII